MSAFADSFPAGGDETLRRDANLLTRFDRVPVTRSVVIAIVLLALVWLVESFDIGIVSTLVLVLKPHWDLAPSDTGLLGASATIGLVLGILPAGRLADRFGRKRALIAGVLIFSVFTLLSALATSIWPLVILRVIAGFGEGAVFPLPYTILSEMVNKRTRGQLMGWTNGVLNAGYTLPALAGYWTTSTFGWELAWRIPLLIGGGFIVLVPFLVKWLPETPRYLLKRAEQRGSEEDRTEVRKWVEKLENEAGLEHDESLLDEDVLDVLRATKKRDVRISTIMKPPYLRRSLVAWCTMCASFVLWYTFLTYSPTILGHIGVLGSQTLLLTAIMMFISAVGTIMQGIAGDRWGRRPVFVTYIVLGALGMVALIFRDAVGTAGAIIAGIVVAWFGLGSFALCKIYTAEQFPTRLRGLGTSIAEMITRALTGGLLIYFLPGLFARWGESAVFTACAIAMVVLLAPIVFFGHETSGQNMEVLGTPTASRTPTEPARSTPRAGDRNAANIIRHR